MEHIDTKGWFRGKCLNKSRWNFQLTDRDVKGSIEEPNKADRGSSEYNYKHLSACKHVLFRLNSLNTRLGVDTKDLKAEGNLYGINQGGKKPPSVVGGIGRHVDGERNTVIAVNLGANRKICLCAYHNMQTIWHTTQLDLEPGDLYIFDRVAAGTSTKGFHIRHWASGGRNDAKYLDRIEASHLKKLKEKLARVTEKNKEWKLSTQTQRLLCGNKATLNNVCVFT